MRLRVYCSGSLSLSLLALVYACVGDDPRVLPPGGANDPSVTPGGDGEVGVDGDAEVEASTGDASDPPDAGPALPQPHPNCRMADTKTGYTITTSPTPASPHTPLEVVATGLPALTNVALAICSPGSADLRAIHPVSVEGFAPPRWTFDAGPLPYGVTQLGFQADPDASTLYETVLVVVQ
jgi:hypothetical protein